jgi:hypothetical protein
MCVKILDVYTAIGGEDTEIVVEFEYYGPLEVYPDEGCQKWCGTVEFSETPRPYETEIVKEYGAKYGPHLPESLTAGRLHEASWLDVALPIYRYTPEERRVFEPVLAAARDYYARTRKQG